MIAAVTKERVVRPLRTSLGSFILPGLPPVSESKQSERERAKERKKKVLVD